MNLRLPILLLCGLLVATGSASTAEEASAEGFWVMKGFVVRISRCATGLCGEMVGLDQHAKPDALRLDSRNSDPAKRDRPLCGLDVFGDFLPSEKVAGKWEGGWVYNPQDGHTYSSEIQLEGAETLRARGFRFVRMLGRNITLTREKEQTARCAPELLAGAG